MWRETLIYATNKQTNNTRYRKTSSVSVLGTTDSKAERIKAISSESRRGNEGTTNAPQCPVDREEDSGGRWAGCCAEWWACLISIETHLKEKGLSSHILPQAQEIPSLSPRVESDLRCAVCCPRSDSTQPVPFTPWPCSSSNVSHLHLWPNDYTLPLTNYFERLW